VKRGGWGAELAALVMEHAFDDLDAPVARVGARAVPMPYNDNLEKAVIPSREDLIAAVRGLL
jgi:pyruvate/2-oxoglutarate/acetoin dehydrogenase E1 component